MKSFVKKIVFIGLLSAFLALPGFAFAAGGDSGASQWISPPTMGAGFGTGASMVASVVNPLSGIITLGTAPAATAVLTFSPAAPTGWACIGEDQTTLNIVSVKTSATSTTTATLYFTLNSAGTFSNAAGTAADKIQFSCIPY